MTETAPRSMPLYAQRRRRNVLTMGLSFAATAFGLSWLVLILIVLLWNGFSGLSLAVFTQMTPPPGSTGGLLNAIAGSLVMTVLAVLIGTPIGMLAGTYMAEYGRYDRLTYVVRFINDILLSAPSIVIGLFVYEIMVAPMGHFSGWAGAVALAVIVIPVVVRTTEDMLTLVPDTLARGGRLDRPAAGTDDHQDRLPRRPRRHGHRRAAGGGAHLRRDRAAAVHRAQQPVLEPQSQRADVQPAGGHLPVRAQPLQGLAESGLDRRADHHPGGAGPEHHRPSPRGTEKNLMNSGASFTVPDRFQRRRSTWMGWRTR